MKKILIISPRFPPVNAADMHRVRQTLPYLPSMNWKPVVLAVHPDRVEGYRDELLLRTVPESTDVQHVNALDPRRTRKVGLGNLALRSLPFYLQEGSKVIRNRRIDLVYFSTTAFPLPILGRYWKWRFDVPYVIDMQDPWHSDFYLQQLKEKRPPKFWFSYYLDKYSEPIAMRGTDAIISVSQGYCSTLKKRYSNIVSETCTVLPFGALRSDFDVLDNADLSHSFFDVTNDTLNVVYVGRGGHDMEQAMHGIAQALKLGLETQPELFERMQFHLIGTSYAPAGQGQKTLEPIAEEYAVGTHVYEHTDRVPYFKTLHLLRTADMLLLPGSIDTDYTASKLYPYIMARKPLLAVFNEQSSVVDILRKTQAGKAVTFDASTPTGDLGNRVCNAWYSMLKQLPYTPDLDWKAFTPYTAEVMARKQVDVFNEVVKQK